MEQQGSKSRPRPIPLGSEPDNHPITGELRISPLNPHVIAKPIAVAERERNIFPMMATVVGKTGAIATPARNTMVDIAHTGMGCRIRYVKTAIATEQPTVTASGEARMRIGVAATRPKSNPHAKPRERTVRARALGIPIAMRYLGNQFQIPNSHAV